MDKNAKVIKGLSIATIVLSALSIIGLLIVIGLLSWVGTMMNDPSVARYLFDDYGYGYGNIYDSYFEEMMLVTGGLSIGIVLILIDVIFHVFVLVTGIMGLRHCNEPEKLNVTFICAITSACLCLIGGGWITMAILIIMAVYIYKFRKGPQMPPAYGYAPSYAQPYYGGPQGQPQQPYYNQAGQPQGYAQPGSAPIPPTANGYAQPATPPTPSAPAVPMPPVPPVAQPSGEQPVQENGPVYHEEGTYQFYEQVEPKTVSVESETVVETLPDLEVKTAMSEDANDGSDGVSALAAEPIASMTGSDIEFAGDLQEEPITGNVAEVSTGIDLVDGPVAAEAAVETEVAAEHAEMEAEASADADAETAEDTDTSSASDTDDPIAK